MKHDKYMKTKDGHELWVYEGVGVVQVGRDDDLNSWWGRFWSETGRTHAYVGDTKLEVLQWAHDTVELRHYAR